MSDILNSNAAMGYTYAMDKASVLFSGTGITDNSIGGYVMNAGLNYARQVQKLYSLDGKGTTHFIVGKAEGQLVLGRLAAAGAVSENFLLTYSDPCNLNKNTTKRNIVITFGVGTCGTDGNTQAAPIPYTAKYCLINSLSMQISAQQIAMTETVTVDFVSLERGKK